MIPNTKIFVGSLPSRTSSVELRHLFQSYGHVTECDIMNRCGFVHMETADQAENAIKALNNSQFKGQNIVVEPGRMKDKNKQGGSSNRGAPGGRGGMGGGNNRSGGERSFNRGSQGNRSFDNQHQGGPMRRDRNFQQSRNNAPYPNRSSDGGPGGNRFGGNQSRWQGSNQSNFDDQVNNMGSAQGGNFGGGSDRFSNSGNSLGNQDRRGFTLPGGNQSFGNNAGNNYNNSSGSNFGGYGGGSQGGNNQGFRGDNNNGNTFGGNNQGGYNRRDNNSQSSQMSPHQQFQERPQYQQQNANTPYDQRHGFNNRQSLGGGNDFGNKNNFGVQRGDSNIGQRDSFVGSGMQRPESFGGNMQMQRPANNSLPRGSVSNFAGPPHKDNNFGRQQQMAIYNQAFPPLGAPGNNRNGPRSNMQNNSNNRRY